MIHIRIGEEFVDPSIGAYVADELVNHRLDRRLPTETHIQRPLAGLPGGGRATRCGFVRGRL